MKTFWDTNKKDIAIICTIASTLSGLTMLGLNIHQLQTPQCIEPSAIAYIEVGIQK